MLHTPIYDVRTRAFCGPTAIASITGLRISLIRDAIRSTSGRIEKSDGHKFPIMGVAPVDLLGAMEELGWHVQEQMQHEYLKPILQNRYRLGHFLEEHGHEGPYIVNVTGHYIAVGWGEACDSHTQIPIEIAKWRRSQPMRWVMNWWKFEISS